MARTLAGIALILILTITACQDADDELPPSKDPSALCAALCGEPAPEVTTDQLYGVMEKYEDLFERQPGYAGAVFEPIADEDEGEADTRRIVVCVEKTLDQGTLPPEDRIPDCLEGVPIQIHEGCTGWQI